MLQVPEIIVGDIVFLPIKRRVRIEGDTVILSKQESCLLESLALCAGLLVTKRMLVAVLQLHCGRRIQSSWIEVRICRLRRKLKRSERVTIHAVRQEGYVLIIAP